MGSLHPSIAAPLRAVVTPRLSLRPLDKTDVDALADVLANREVWQFEYGRGMTRIETQAFLDRQLKLWVDFGFGGCGVHELRSPDLVGVVGLSVPTVFQDRLPAVTVGWRFSPTVRGKGYATEAATAVLDQAFTTMALDRVGCVTGAANTRSVALAERLGMTFVAEEDVPRDDDTRAVAKLFQIARADWLNARNQPSTSQTAVVASRSGEDAIRRRRL